MTHRYRGPLAAVAAMNIALVVVACGDDDPAPIEPVLDSGAGDVAVADEDSAAPDVSDGGIRDATVDAAAPEIECSVTPCVLDIATAGNSTCALLADGTVSCWGSNEHGQLGRGALDAGQDGHPAPATGLANVTQLSGGVNGYCARKSDGSVACWGDNRVGQIGPLDDPSELVDVPRIIAGLPKATAAFMGEELACAALEGGDATCWGKNTAGRLPTLHDAGEVPVGPTKIDLGGRQIAAIAPGKSAVVALTDDGELLSWGRRSRPVVWEVTGLGREVSLELAMPAALPSPKGVMRLVGWGDGVAATAAGRAFRWGAVDFADGPVLPTPVPVATTAAALWVSFGEGGQFCAVLGDKSVRCLGNNSYGQIGTGEYTNREIVARKVEDLPAQPARVVTSGYHACAVLVTGEALCWGNNMRGQLGSGDFALHPTPTPVRFSP